MFEYRVTKYDPAHRDARGAYLRDEWTSFGHVGSSFGGAPLTAAQYETVEHSYVTVAIDFWREVGRPTLVVRGLENAGARPAPSEGSAIVDEARLADVIRRVLREEFWCRLEGDGAFIHFGWDYYMYIGGSTPCSGACAVATASGLFAEPFVSPYHPEDGT